MRGLISAHNFRAAAFASVDLERWMRLTRLAFQTEKIDLLLDPQSPPDLAHLLEFAASLDARLSVRAHTTQPISGLRPLRDQGLLDVFVVIPGRRIEALGPWCAACAASEIPLRLQVHAPLPESAAWDATARRLADAGVRIANLAVSDPFVPVDAPFGTLADARAGIDKMRRFATALNAAHIEANLIGLPFCMAEAGERRFIVNTRQFFRDPNQYERHSYDWALRLYRMGPVRAKQAILMLLGQHTSFADPIDRKLLPWIIEHPWVRARAWAFHKLLRHTRLFRRAQPASRLLEFCETGARDEASSPECSACALRRICDQCQGPLARGLPDALIQRVEGPHVLDPLQYRTGRSVYCDPVDAARLDAVELPRDLAEEAKRIVGTTPPDRVVDSLDYRVEGQWALQLPDSVRWFSFTHTEKLSTPLARLEPPFTIAATFGSGIAEYIGFSFGRHGKILTPMTAYAHQLVLHVAADGRYILLCDGVPVSPVAPEGLHYVPTRLGAVLEPRISIWNIDSVIGTQGVQIWHGRAAIETTARTVKYTVLTICTRYARRLQATLLTIAHQQNVAIESIEVIVAYVPGLDAVGDVLNTVEATFPSLRIVRSPFSVQDAAAKGFMINESLRMASGEWVMLLDADILLPPDMFARIEQLPDSCSFVIPDGRKMLSRDVTARILLGLIQPWRDWDSLLNGPGEYRRAEVNGTPIGFCQCVRRHCFDAVQYEEMRHFEGADWKFGRDIRDRFGPEHRLSGAPVLHLDHGGSHWYGATSHW